MERRGQRLGARCGSGRKHLDRWPAGGVPVRGPDWAMDFLPGHRARTEREPDLPRPAARVARCRVRDGFGSVRLHGQVAGARARSLGCLGTGRVHRPAWCGGHAWSGAGWGRASFSGWRVAGTGESKKSGRSPTPSPSIRDRTTSATWRSGARSSAKSSSATTASARPPCSRSPALRRFPTSRWTGSR